MEGSQSYIVASTPRSGSSALGKLLTQSGGKQLNSNSSVNQSSSIFNPHGYFEDSGMNLCLDNLIRFAYSTRNSFLHTSGLEIYAKELMLERILSPQQDYDLTLNQVEIPPDFEVNIERYTGHDWDVWGLTRMKPGMKWFQAYSRVGVNTPEKALEFFKHNLDAREHLDFSFMKDPRIVYVAPLIPREYRFIIIKREKKDILRSMRNHYGPNLFTKNVIFSNWVSNHFNYKIEPQDFDQYITIYFDYIEHIKRNRDYVEIEFEDLFDNRNMGLLSKFLNREIFWRS